MKVKVNSSQSSRISNGTIRLLLTAVVMIFTTYSIAQIAVSNTLPTPVLANKLTGPGVQLSNITKSCPNISLGYFTENGSGFPLQDGIVLTTGATANLIGPNVLNSTSVDNMNGSDVDLSSLVTQSTYNKCVLEFDVTPSSDTLQFRYIFASEEYPEYVCSQFNDVFAFFISGPGIIGSKNLAVIPGTTTPVSINSINSDSCGIYGSNPPALGSDTTNSSFYVDNTGGVAVEFDGYTVTLTAKTYVQPCQKYHLKLAIADVFDELFDSGVFIEGGSLRSEGMEISEVGTTDPTFSNAVEGCLDGQVTFSIEKPKGAPYNFTYGLSGTATNGVDYSNLTGNATIPTGDTSVTITVSALPDGIADDNETVIIYLYHPCNGSIIDTAILTIRDEVNAQILPGGYVSCNGSPVQLNALGGDSILWTPSTGLSCNNCFQPNANPANTTRYTATIFTGPCTDTVSAVVNVVTNVISNAGNDVTICGGDATTVGSTGFGGVNYLWSPAIGLNAINVAQPTASPLSTITYQLIVSAGVGTCADTSEVTVTVNNPVNLLTTPNASICIQDSTAMYAGGALSYTWTPSTGLSCTTCNTPIAAPAVTTTYTVIGSNNNGCTDTAEITITVIDPGVQAPVSETLCRGSNVQLNASNGTTHTWSPSAGLSCTNCQNPLANPTTTTTYTCTISTSTGCSMNETFTVNVFPLATSNAGNDTSFCSGGSVQLNAIGTGSPTWYPVTGLSCINCLNPIANPVASSTYTVIFTDSLGCTSADTINVGVHPYPTADAGPNSVTTCSGVPVQLNATGGVTYSWLPTTGLSNPNIANPTANPASTTNYTVTVTDVNGCSDTDNVTVNIANGVSINTSSNVSICVGDSTPLSASGGVSYTWMPSSGLSNANIANPMASPASTTVYELIVTNNGGCQDTAWVTITVNPLLIANAGSDVTICEGASTNLNASGGIIYAWTPTTGLSNPNIANPIANPTSTTLYTVTVTNANGCTDTSSVNVTVNPLPTADAGPSSASVCPNGTVNLNATGGVSYLWTPSTGLSNANIANPVATMGASSITYTVTVTDANNCTASDTIQVIVLNGSNANVSNDTSICIGASVQILATGGTAYSWTPATGLSNTNTANPTANPTSTTNYTVTVTNAGGCTSTGDVMVTVNPLPTANAGSNVSICHGSSTNLSASGGVTYSWTPTTGLSNANIANPIANPTITTLYTVNVTNANGCTDTSSVYVTVNPLPTADAGPSSTSICPNGTVNLNATGGVSYVWTPTTGLSNANIANPVATMGSTSITYTVTVTDANGCVADDTIRVNVSNGNNANAGNDTSVCTGGNVQLLATGGVSYLWTPSTGLNNPNIANPIATMGASASTYIVTVTDASGCIGSDTINVNILNGNSANVSNDTSICIGENIQISATGGASYSWTPVTGLSNANISNPIANPTTTTNYTVTVTNVGGCITTGNVVVTVNSLPTAYAGSNVAICEGSSTNLNATGGVTYSWTPTTGLSNANIANPTANPITTTLYTVTVTNANGCTDTSSVNVTVNPLPTADAGPSSASVCPNGTVNLNATGGVSYVWTPATGLSNANIANPIATMGATSITYTVTVTDANNCTATDTIRVSVLNGSNANVSNDTTICNGESVQLLASGGTSYAWSPAAGLSNANIANPIANPTSTTNYTVTITNAGGCSSTGNVNVGISNLPTADAGNNTAICNGSTTNLNATGGAAYSWFPSTNLSNANIANPVASPTTTTIFTVTVTNASGCSDTDRVTITVNPLPIADAGLDTVPTCLGVPVPLAASGGTSYSWSPAAGLSCTNCPNPLATVAAPTAYTVTVTNAQGCSSQDVVVVDLSSAITGTVTGTQNICSGDSVQLQATGGTNYNWFPTTGLSCSTCPNPKASPASNTVYSVTISNSTGCADIQNVNVNVNSLPVVNGGVDQNICLGETANLTSIGANTYNWSPAATLSCTNCPNPTANPAVTTTYIVSGTSANGCINTDTVVVNVNGLPNANAGFDSTICTGENSQLLASGGVNFQWFPATNLSNANIANPVANPVVTTTYAVVVSNGNNCSDTDRVTITVMPQPIANAGVDTIICEGNNINLLATGGSSYSWAPAAGLSCTSCPNPVASPNTTTNYTVTVTSASGCNATDNVTVTVDPLPTLNTSGGSATYCIGSTTQLNVAGGATYNWTPNVGLSCYNCPDPIVNDTVSRMYYVTATNLAGCIAMDSIFVQVSPLPAAAAGRNRRVCAGDDVLIGANTVVGNIYSWAPGIGLDDSTSSNPLFNYTNTTNAPITINYVLTVTNIHGCVATDNISITVNPVPFVELGEAINLVKGKYAQLNADGTPTSGDTYKWFPNRNMQSASIAQPMVNPSRNTVYTLTITNIHGCRYTDDVEVIVNERADVIVPTAFSPNDDGRNDVFRVIPNNVESLKTFEVYNRWGQKIYENNGNINDGWDGYFNGEAQEIGAYAFYIEAVPKDGHGDEVIQLKGSVTLIR